MMQLFGSTSKQTRWSNVDFVDLMGLLYILLEVGFIYIQLKHSSTYHDV